jgi:hypothetical protein
LFVLACGPSVAHSGEDVVAVPPVGDAQRQPDLAGAAEAACPAVAAESAYCMTSSEGDAYLVGLDTGQLCELAMGQALRAGPDGCASRAWLRDDVLTCTSPGASHGGLLFRFRLPGGGWESTELACGAATRWSNGFVVTEGDGLTESLLYFEDFAQAAGSAPVSTLPVALNSTCFAAQRDVLYVVGSDDSIQPFALPGGAPLPPVAPQGMSSPVTGLSVLADGRIALLSWDVIRVLDPSSGAVLREVTPTPQVGTLAGLTCRESNAPDE